MGGSGSGTAFLLLVCVLCLGIACKGLDPAQDEVEGRVEATLALMNSAGETAEVFKQGDPILMELTLRNRSGEDRVFKLPSSQRYEFEVHDGQPVWHWSNGLGFADVITHLELPAGGALVFKETWDQTSDGGRPVPLGRYEAEAYVPGKSGELSADPLEFRIE